jgi:c-di-GMP-binding flagellar brake protein YcgR
MQKIKLTLGEKVFIKTYMPDGKLSSIKFIGKIEELTNLSNIIAVSFLATSAIKQCDAENFQLILARDEAAFICNAEVFEQKKENGVFVVIFKMLNDFNRVQRREFYRLKITLDLEVINFGHGKTIDISGNGISFRIDKPIENVDTLICTVNLHDDEFIIIKGSIVRIEKKSSNYYPGFYIVRLRYVDIKPRDQDTIVKFINQQQILRKRLFKD